MRKIFSYMFVILTICFLFSSCTKTAIKVGNGSQTGATETATQWYALWGIVPLGEVDTKKMVGDSQDYEYSSQISGLNLIINIILGTFTITSRDVTIKK